MADATQVQIRRDTATNLNAVTPALAELGYDQTNKRIVIGDGTTLGGIQHSSFNDTRNGNFIRGTVGGTANALTVTQSPIPVSYDTGMRIGFTPSANNTASVTVNVNGLGVRTLQKFNGTALNNLVSGDLRSGVYYEAIYNGSVFQLTTLYSSGLVSIGQGDLRTSIGVVSRSSIGTSYLLLPGGEYGFYPRSWRSGNNLGSVSVGILQNALYSLVSTAPNSYISLTCQNNITASPTVNAQQRYITSSPPYDLGDGDVGGFFFALVNNDGEIVSTYLADAPPWAYNGPTSVKADKICRATGRKFRTVPKKRTLEQIMDGAPLEFVDQEITQKIKNADMGVIPHPFGEIPEGHHVVLLDPMDDRVRKLIDFQNAGGSEEVSDYISKGKFRLGAECKRHCPKGVHTHKLDYKYTDKFNG